MNITFLGYHLKVNLFCISIMKEKFQSRICFGLRTVGESFHEVHVFRLY